MRRFGQPMLPLLFTVALSACNGPPEGGTAAILPEAPTTSDNLVLEIVQEAVDPDKKDSVSYDITWLRDGTEVVEVASLSQVNSSLTKRGEVWSVEVTANDGVAWGQPFSAETTIVNAPPTAKSVTLAPTEPVEGDTIVATAAGSDADLDTVSFTYAWFVDGTQVDETSGELGSDAFDKGSAIYVEVTPTDGDAEGEPLTSEPVRAVNTPPSASGAEISPADDAKEGSTLTCTGTGWSDADDDDEGYQFAWLVNDKEVGTGQTLTGEAFDRGDSVVCMATPDDGEDSGSPVRSSAIIIRNTAPALAGAELSSTAPVEGETLSLTLGEANDVDGDEISFAYAWYVEETKVGSGETLSSDWFAKGDTVYALITPSDDADAGEAVKSDVATVGNTAPEITGIALSGPITAESSSITATATSSDVDGDDISYSAAWYVNGSKVTGSTLTLSRTFKKGDTIYADITADDGDDTSTERSETATVQNTAPGTPTISMANATPAETDDIICKLDKVATDIDGDTLSYRFSWKRNGVTWTGLMGSTVYTNDTIGKAATAGGNVWTCSVEAYDGTAYGVAASTAATVKATWPGTATFSTCSVTGHVGPSQTQCDTAYASTVLKGKVTVTGGIQDFTVPSDGTYRIEVWGAQGGKCGGRGCGGKGARMRGDFSLKSGDVLHIVVGQEGGYKGFGSGGGGGTYVVKKTGTAPLVIAGAGGGAGHTGTVGYNGTTASCGTNGGYASYGAGGCSGNGGSSSSSYGGTYNNSGGGGGFNGDGVGDGTKTNPGKSFKNGSGGGKDTGGFGGGGGGEVHAWNCSNGNGGGSGGGGYSGGGGGGGSCNGPGGGGGSYNAGGTQSNSSGVQAGHGKVVISRL